MRNTEQLEQTERAAMFGQIISAVMTLALIAIVAVQVPDILIWVISSTL